MVKIILDDFYEDKSTPNAWLRLSAQTINICHKYLKLHEENQRLRAALERITNIGSKQVENIACEALKEPK